MYMSTLFWRHISLSMNNKYGLVKLLNVAMELKLQCIDILKISKLVLCVEIIARSAMVVSLNIPLLFSHSIAK